MKKTKKCKKCGNIQGSISKKCYKCGEYMPKFEYIKEMKERPTLKMMQILYELMKNSIIKDTDLSKKISSNSSKENLINTIRRLRNYGFKIDYITKHTKENRRYKRNKYYYLNGVFDRKDIFKNEKEIKNEKISKKTQKNHG